MATTRARKMHFALHSFGSQRVMGSPFRFGYPTPTNAAENKSPDFFAETDPACLVGRQVSDAAIVFSPAQFWQPGPDRISHAKTWWARETPAMKAGPWAIGHQGLTYSPPPCRLGEMTVTTKWLFVFNSSFLRVNQGHRSAEQPSRVLTTPSHISNARCLLGPFGGKLRDAGTDRSDRTLHRRNVRKESNTSVYGAPPHFRSTPMNRHAVPIEILFFGGETERFPRTNHATPASISSWS